MKHTEKHSTIRRMLELNRGIFGRDAEIKRRRASQQH